MEKRSLDVSGLYPELLRKVPDDHQELIPVPEVKAYATWVFLDRAQLVQELPDSDVNDAVALWVEQCEQG